MGRTDSDGQLDYQIRIWPVRHNLDCVSRLADVSDQLGSSLDGVKLEDFGIFSQHFFSVF